MLLDTWIIRLSDVAEAWCAAIFVVSLKTTIVLAVTMLLLKCVRRLSATMRHLILFLALTSPVALVLLPKLLPQWRSPIANSAWSSWLANSGPSSADPLPTPVVESESAVTGAFGVDSASVGSNRLAKPSASPQSTRTVSSRALVSRIPISVWLLLIWGMGCIWLVSRLLVGELRLRRHYGLTVEVRDSRWLTLLAACARRLGVRGRVSLKLSRIQTMPMVHGIWRAKIVLPKESVGWSDECRRSVLQHELAHIARRDCLTSLIAQTICIFHWFNPFSWGVLQMIKNERERACDDLVLSTGVPASTYAEQVLTVAARLGNAHRLDAALGMARPSQLEGRLLAVLVPSVTANA